MRILTYACIERCTHCCERPKMFETWQQGTLWGRGRPPLFLVLSIDDACDLVIG